MNSKSLYISGESSNAFIQTSVFGDTQTFDDCRYFVFNGTINQVSVRDTEFQGFIDSPQCFKNSTLKVNNNVLRSVTYQDFIQSTETYVYYNKIGVNNLLFINGTQKYRQYDGNQNEIVLFLSGGDISAELKYEVGYGSKTITVLSKSSLEQSLIENPIPDVIELRQTENASCVSLLQLVRGADVLLHLNFSVFESCSQICAISSTTDKNATLPVPILYMTPRINV